MISANALFTVSRVCKMTGLELEEIQRLEEKMSHLLKVRTTSAGNRLYTGADIEKLKTAGHSANSGGPQAVPTETPVSMSDTLPGLSSLDRADAEAIARAAHLADTATAVNGGSADGSPAETLAFSQADVAAALVAGTTGAAAAAVAEIEPLEEEAGPGFEMSHRPEASDTQRPFPETRLSAVEPGAPQSVASHADSPGEPFSATQAEEMAANPAGRLSTATDSDSSGESFRKAGFEETSGKSAITHSAFESGNGSGESLPPASAELTSGESTDTQEAPPDEISLEGTPEDASGSSGNLVPPLPVAPTLDLLLEAAEGLVQENLKLRKAVDLLAARCEGIEGRLDVVEQNGSKRRRFWFFKSA